MFHIIVVFYGRLLLWVFLLGKDIFLIYHELDCGIATLRFCHSHVLNYVRQGSIHEDEFVRLAILEDFFVCILAVSSPD